MPHCVSCGFESPGQMRFCGACSQPLPMACRKCGLENPPGFRFCGGCGLPLAGPPLAAAPELEADRRQLSVLFCDLVGSTELSEKLDPEDLRELLREYQTLCAEVIEAYSGHIAQYLGDGLLVYFGFPQANEDDSVRAVHAGLGIVKAIERRGIHQMRSEGHRLAVRVGIHTGPVVAGRMGVGETSENLAVGRTPNLAARLQSLAEPNMVLLSSATYQLVRGFFRCRSLGERALKGIGGPVEVWQVEAPSGARSRFEVVLSQGLTPAVGRQRELSSLVDAFARSRQGSSQVALVRGEAGIGKSRLLQTFKEAAAPDQPRWLICRCSPFHQNSAFNPILEMMQQVLGFRPEHPPEKRLARLERRLAIIGLASDESVALLASILSLPLGDRYPPLDLGPQRQKEKTLDLLVAVLTRLTEAEPVVLAVEDVHWIDPSSLELLDRLARRPSAIRLFCLFTCRPAFTHSWPEADHFTELILQPLDRDEVKSIVREISASRPLPEDVLEQIVRKTDGVPLFVEELTKAVLESYRTGALSSLAIPATLEDSLRARLDRLGSAKSAVQIAATVGREFGYELLRLVYPHPEDRLRQDLLTLVRAELLYQRGVPPAALYTFKHALIQEAAYNSILKTARRQIHARIAEALADIDPEIGTTQPELLAHHYTEAGLLAPAVQHWLRAGALAADRSAEVESVAHLRRGLALVEQMPESRERFQLELELQNMLGRTWSIGHSFAAPEVEQAYRRALDLCLQLGDIPQVFAALMGLWSFHIVRDDIAVALEIASRLMRQAESMHHSPALVAAHFACGTTRFFFGDLPASQGHLDNAVALDTLLPRAPASAARVDPGVLARSYRGLNVWMQGSPDRALACVTEAFDLAGGLGHAYSQAEAHFFASWMHELRGEVTACRHHAREAVRLCEERGFGFWREPSLILLNAARAQETEDGDGVDGLQEAFSVYLAAGSGVSQTYYLALLAEELLRRKRIAEADQVLVEAFAVSEKTGAAFWLAELHRLRGEAALASSSGEAENHFQEALAAARQQRAASLELRAASSLARLRIRQGRKAEARETLSPVYERFTEGFQTADLQEARQLLL